MIDRAVWRYNLSVAREEELQLRIVFLDRGSNGCEECRSGADRVTGLLARDKTGHVVETDVPLPPHSVEQHSQWPVVLSELILNKLDDDGVMPRLASGT